MTYNELISFRDKEKTGIAKGYSIEFLQNFFSKEKLEKVIARDLAMFEEIEKSLLNINQPVHGDYVEFDGKISRLSVTHGDGSIQLSDGIGVYVSDSFSQASGCVWDPNINIERNRLNINNLKLTPKVKKGRCWTFSGNEAGGGRGVYFEINFKVWKLD